MSGFFLMKIKLTNFSTLERRVFKGNESLDVEDYVRFAEKAKSQRLFHLSISFARGAALLLDKQPKTNNKKLAKVVKTLKKQLSKLNNQHILKWRKSLGSNYMALPYLIDEDLNKKPTQPADLLRSLYVLDIENDFQQEFVMRSVCQRGTFVRRDPTEDLPKCGFLHHFDPYLRLGPFKVEVVEKSPYLSILHGILTEEEIQWIVDYSRPRLSKSRANEGTVKVKNPSTIYKRNLFIKI